MDSSLKWKTISFAPDYKISENGDVYSTITKKIITPRINHCYIEIRLPRISKTRWFRVHRLVATIFIPNPEEKPYVDHIDRNKNNNHVSNLRWVTPSENRNNSDTKYCIDFRKDRNKWRIQYSPEPKVRKSILFNTREEALDYANKMTNGTGIIKRDMYGKMIKNIT